MNDKAGLRERMRAVRRAVPREARRSAAERVHAQLATIDLPGPLLIYVSAKGELGTRRLLVPGVCVPRIEPAGHMVAIPFTALVDGAFGIPTCAGDPVAPGAVLVPGLAFDRTGGRLGYGGGYYDRFLEANPGAVTIGLAYDGQIVDQVPTEPHDVVLDGVLTPAGWVKPVR